MRSGGDGEGGPHSLAVVADRLAVDDFDHGAGEFVLTGFEGDGQGSCLAHPKPLDLADEFSTTTGGLLQHLEVVDVAAFIRAGDELDG